MVSPFRTCHSVVPMSACSGIILAGGDGTRLRAFTRRLASDERPKQFCRIIVGDTLLDQTRRRARLLRATQERIGRRLAST
jgi:mannose-1-phosphate guanylyltransferase